jgi:tellurite resistance-related uncharacterized protein
MPWVVSEEGRAQKLGAALPCPLCHMPRRPPCAQVYKETPVFDSDTVPAGLLKTHALRADSWGEIVVLEGRVEYVLEDDDDRTLVLRPGITGIVAPERPHHVALAAGARFFVRFLRPTEAPRRTGTAV